MFYFYFVRGLPVSDNTNLLLVNIRSTPLHFCKIKDTMKWFEGDIGAAVQSSKSKHVILMVYIEGIAINSIYYFRMWMS